MPVLYSIGIFFYYVMVAFVSLFNPKAKLWIKGRKGIFKQLQQQIEPTDEYVWFHCASLGEFEQGRPVIEEFRARFPQYKVLLTFFSPSGYEVRKNYAGADLVFYLPLDTRGNARKFISIVKPHAVVFIKYEFWYYYLTALKKNNVPTFLLSSIFQKKQVFFKFYGGLFRRMLRSFTCLFVQNEESKKLLNSIGITEVQVSGDTRFDRVYAIARQAKELPIIQQFTEGHEVLLAGSTWPKDEEAVFHALEANPRIKLIIAPHETHEAHVEEIVNRFAGYATLRYTKAEGQNAADYKVLIIDTIGILSSAYHYAQVAYIGGGFGVGIHNTLEAATFGIPVLFGPNYQKFQEAKDLIAGGGAFSISTPEELAAKVQHLFSDEDYRKTSGNYCKTYVESKLGATEQFINYVTPRLK